MYMYNITMKKQSNKPQKDIDKHFKAVLESDPVRNTELDQENLVDLPIDDRKSDNKKKKNKNDIISEEC
jgi:hypothetical protein